MEAVKQTPAIDLGELRRVYDEHEVRTATYLGRDLDDNERINLGVDGLAEVWKVQNRSIGDFEIAADTMAEQIRAGETVGHALTSAISKLDRGE